MDKETLEWITQTLTQLTASRNQATARQRVLIENLNEYVRNEFVRLSQAPSLKAYNDGIKALGVEVNKRFEEIIAEETNAIAAMLGAAFALVFLSHMQFLARRGNVDVQLPEDLDITKTYQGYILGRFYVKALHNVRKGFVKRMMRDSEHLRRQYLSDGVDLADIYLRREKAARESEGHFRFIDDQELHRVFEAAKYETAVYLREVLGIDTEKFWETREDDRVRDTMKASHVAMQSVTIPGHELFDLVPFGKAYAPANSGIADQDCNCRCMAIYSIV